MLDKITPLINKQKERNDKRLIMKWYDLLMVLPSAVLLDVVIDEKGEWEHNKEEKVYIKTDYYHFQFFSELGLHGIEA